MESTANIADLILEGINVKRGIELVGDDSEFYKSLLMDFDDTYKNMSGDIQNAINNKDLKLAERLAHTTKGSAGTLGMEELFSAAVALESSIRKNADTQISANLALYDAKLKIVLKSTASIK